MMGTILLTGRTVLSWFSTDPQVIGLGYLRLQLMFATFSFTLHNEVITGYMNGYGRSLVPTVITAAGICGIRTLWILFAFPKAPSFRTILYAFPVSLAATTAMNLAALCIIRPGSRAGQGDNLGGMSL